MKFVSLLSTACLLFFGVGCGEPASSSLTFSADNRTSEAVTLLARAWSHSEHGASSFQAIVDTIAAGATADFRPFPGIFEIENEETLYLVVDASTNGGETFHRGAMTSHKVTSPSVTCSVVITNHSDSDTLFSELHCQ